MTPSVPVDVRSIFETHADFVWRVLARSGVRDADLRDATQEVFIVVAQKLPEREGSSALSTWLYGIAIRIAANYRRKAHRKREDLVDAPPENATRSDPEVLLLRAEARQRLAEVLEELPMDERIVFTMFELEEMTGQAIAASLGIPVGTVHTRLRAARATFERKARQLSRAKVAGA